MEQFFNAVTEYLINFPDSGVYHRFLWACIWGTLVASLIYSSYLLWLFIDDRLDEHIDRKKNQLHFTEIWVYCIACLTIALPILLTLLWKIGELFVYMVIHHTLIILVPVSVILVALLARYTRRLNKAFNKHIKDNEAHKNLK